jgi:hypothetical protein
VEGIHIHGIAFPGERLAEGLHVYSGESADGAAGAVVAGDPLRKYQRDCARLYGNAQVRVINVSRRVGEIHVELDGLGKDYSLQQGNREEAS